ncbi:CBS domain-containing protein [Actinoplanes sp. NPDC023714]|uniref:CBS domain-containing protein n=1 Tax=Actinoplanes sp. NPDC023714 TaxID=3154322 RepID=UPI0033F2D344
MKTWHVTDVMTGDVLAAGPQTPYRDLVALVADNHINAVPVIGGDRQVLGVVTESDLLLKIEYAGEEQPHWYARRRRARLHKAAGQTAAELMTAPAVVALTTTSVAGAARAMDEAGVKQLPVVDDEGRLAGIVTRGDLLKEHLRSDDDIRTDARAAAREVLLGEDNAHLETEVEGGIVTLSGKVERWSTAVLLVRLMRQVPGVVDVTDHVSYDFDDRKEADPLPAIFIA